MTEPTKEKFAFGVMAGPKEILKVHKSLLWETKSFPFLFTKEHKVAGHNYIAQFITIIILYSILLPYIYIFLAKSLSCLCFIMMALIG